MKTQIFLFAFLGCAHCAHGRNNTTSNVGNAIGNETLMQLIEKLEGEVRNNSFSRGFNRDNTGCKKSM